MKSILNYIVHENKGRASRIPKTLAEPGPWRVCAEGRQPEGPQLVAGQAGGGSSVPVA